MKRVDDRAEHAVLSALFIRLACWHDVEPLLRPEDFGNPRHRVIAESIWAIKRRDEPLDFVTMTAELERAGKLNLANDTLTSLMAEHIVDKPVHHAKRVRAIAAGRRMVEYLVDRAEDGRAFDDDPLEYIEETARRVTALADVRRESELVHIADLAHAHIAEIQARARGVARGHATGIEKLDALTGGVQPGQFTVIAARPSCGKSALAMQLATTIGDREPVAFFSSEMKRMLCMDRWCAESGSVPLHSIRDGRLSRDEFAALIRAYERMKRSAGIYIADRRGWKVNEIVAQVRAWKREVCRPRPCKGCDGKGATDGVKCDPCDGTGARTPRPFVVVDYLQIVKPSDRHHSREQDVAEVSGTFQALAGEEDVALVVLCQLSREVDKRAPEQVPTLADLRESGAIEQDADNVWFVHRPDRIDENRCEPGATILSVGKQKHGECANVPLWFRGQYQRFIPRDRDESIWKPQEPKTTKPGDHMPKRGARPRGEA
jgi:replicative DNA helicase